MEGNLVTGEPESDIERAKRESLSAAARGVEGAVKFVSAPTAIAGSKANWGAAKAGTVEARALTARDKEEMGREHIVQTHSTKLARKAQEVELDSHKTTRNLEEARLKTAIKNAEHREKRSQRAELKVSVKSSLKGWPNREIGHVNYVDQTTWENRTVRDVTDTIAQMLAYDAASNSDIDAELLGQFLSPSAAGAKFIRNFIGFSEPTLKYEYDRKPEQPFQTSFLRDKNNRNIVFTKARHDNLMVKLKEKTDALTSLPPVGVTPETGQEGGSRQKRRTRRSKRKNRRTKRSKRSKRRTRRTKRSKRRNRRTRRSKRRTRRTRRTRRKRSMKGGSRTKKAVAGTALGGLAGSLGVQAATESARHAPGYSGMTATQLGSLGAVGGVAAGLGVAAAIGTAASRDHKKLLLFRKEMRPYCIIILKCVVLDHFDKLPSDTELGEEVQQDHNKEYIKQMMNAVRQQIKDTEYIDRIVNIYNGRSIFKSKLMDDMRDRRDSALEVPNAFNTYVKPKIDAAYQEVIQTPTAV